MTAIRYLEGIMNLKLEWEPPVELKPAKMSDLKPEPTVKLEELLEDLLMRDIALRLTEELKRRVNLNLESVLREIKELENGTKEHEIESLVKTKCELENEWTSKLELKRQLENKLDFLLRQKWALNVEVVLIQECMAQLEGKLSLEVKHLEPKLKEEVALLLEKERVLEQELIGRNRDLEIDQRELMLQQGPKLTVERVRELQDKLACLEELKRMPERQRGQELDQVESNVKQKLDFLLEQEREPRHEIDVMELGHYQVLKLILDPKHRWKRQQQEYETHLNFRSS